MRARLFSALSSFALVLLVACTSTKSDADGDADPCAPDDADGVLGGSVSFEVTVNDTSFAPAVLKAQNLAHVMLTVKNTGTKPHDLVFDCLPTPNQNGCATMSCFPAESKVAVIAPGASAIVNFMTPNPEGIYNFHSDVTGDKQSGQFIVQ